MAEYYLAVDIGASSGRHILGWLEDGKIRIEEIYRFPNGMKEMGGSLCWDVQALFSEIRAGLKRCGELGKIPSSMGIDTWGVDYVLLDDRDQVLGKTYGYRDKRTSGMPEKVYGLIPQKELYARTGIQKQNFNTIYQLMAVKQQEPELLEKAAGMLLMPDYLNFLLTGVKRTEYTNATTSQLVSPRTKDWDYELIDLLGYPRRIFGKISRPGTYLGMGTEIPEADCSMECMEHNLTNEGGYDYRFRFLKNIMGLWMIQSVRKEFTEEYSYAHICEQASRQLIPSIVDCNDDRFLAPESMTEAVKSFCRESGQQVPANEWETAAVIYNSLGQCYADTIREIEALTGKHYDRIHVVGGGSNAEYLNRITARYTGRTVCAGPGEATAIGNLLVQMISDGVFKNLKEARACVRDSFDIRQYRE